MIQTVLGVFLILLHIVCCVLVWLGIKTHLLKVKKYLMALVIFVPFWGTVCVLLLHLQMLTRRNNRIEPGVEKLDLLTNYLYSRFLTCEFNQIFKK